jgi:hypothetical protein
MLNQHFEDGGSYSTAASLYDLPRHRWYVIKEGFSPELFNLAVSEAPIEKDDLVIDPFCGSGTVPVTASLQGYRSIGIEVNPFLAFVARTKLATCSANSLDSAIASILPSIKQGSPSPLEGFSTFCRRPESEKWLFNRSILRSFEGGWQASKALRGQPRDIVRLMLVRAAMENCNAIADGKCLRYRRDWKTTRFGKKDFIESFESWILKARDDLGGLASPEAKASIVSGDARVLLKSMDAEGIGLCITSPPYLNSFDYSDVYRPETFLIKAVRSNEDLRKIRLASVRSHVQVRWPKPVLNRFGSVFAQTMKQLLAKKGAFWDEHIPQMVQAYFEDMNCVLTGLRAGASKKSRVWLVVSTSAYAGVEIPVDLILAQIGESVGWFLQEVRVLRSLRASGQHAIRVPGEEVLPFHLRESVVMFCRERIRDGNSARQVQQTRE